MLLISHRGNLNGPEPDYENSPRRIDECIKIDLDVEIDVWYVNDTWMLGHDTPQYEVDYKFLKNRLHNLWIHCKNVNAMNKLFVSGENFNYFWHQEDDYTLTSLGYIWTFPKQTYESFFNNQIILDFSKNRDYNYYKSKNILGMCCDYIY